MLRFAALLGLIAVACADPPKGARETPSDGGAAGVGGAAGESGSGGSKAPSSGGSAHEGGAAGEEDGGEGGESGLGGSTSPEGGTGGASGGSGGGGAQCDEIAACDGASGACSAVIGSSCGSCKIGSFSCGSISGWYFDDGAEFPCDDGDCSGALSAAGQHCASCSNGSGGSGGGSGGTGGAGQCTPSDQCVKGSDLCEGCWYDSCAGIGADCLLRCHFESSNGTSHEFTCGDNEELLEATMAMQEACASICD